MKANRNLSPAAKPLLILWAAWSALLISLLFSSLPSYAKPDENRKVIDDWLFFFRDNPNPKRPVKIWLDKGKLQGTYKQGDAKAVPLTNLRFEKDLLTFDAPDAKLYSFKFTFKGNDLEGSVKDARATKMGYELLANMVRSPKPKLSIPALTVPKNHR